MTSTAAGAYTGSTETDYRFKRLSKSRFGIVLLKRFLTSNRATELLPIARLCATGH